MQHFILLQSDVVVVSCDLITDVDISGVLDMFRRHDAAISAMFFHTDNTPSTLPTPGPKSKDKTGRQDKNEEMQIDKFM